MKSDNGSFNIWTQVDENSDNIWFSSYIIQLLCDAREIIDVEKNLINDAITHLVSKQKEDGSFYENPTFRNLVIDATKNYLTSFALISLLRNPSNAAAQISAEKAINFIEDERLYNCSNRDYDCAIGAYALALANHNESSEILHSKIKNNFYNLKNGVDSTKNLQKESVFIEVASYVTLWNLYYSKFEAAFKPLEWLMSRRRKLGKFLSDYDTVIGLNAISKFAYQYDFTNNIEAKVTVLSDNEKLTDVEVRNFMDSDIIDIKDELKRENLQLKFEGNGWIYANVWQQYKYSKPSRMSNTLSIVNIQAFLKQVNNSDAIEINIEKLSSIQKLIAIEITLPSGYVYLSHDNLEIIKVF